MSCYCNICGKSGAKSYGHDPYEPDYEHLLCDKCAGLCITPEGKPLKEIKGGRIMTEPITDRDARYFNDGFEKGKHAQLNKDKIEILKDLEHIYKYFTKLTISNKIEKWEVEGE